MSSTGSHAQFDKTNQMVSNLNESFLNTNQKVSELGDVVIKMSKTSEQGYSRISGIVSGLAENVAENVSKSEQKFDILVESTTVLNRIVTRKFDEYDANFGAVRQTLEGHDQQMQVLRHNAILRSEVARLSAEVADLRSVVDELVRAKGNR